MGVTHKNELDVECEKKKHIGPYFSFLRSYYPSGSFERIINNVIRHNSGLLTLNKHQKHLLYTDTRNKVEIYI